MSYTLVPSELIVDGAITSAKLDTNISISGTLGVTGELTLATHLNMGDNDKIKIGTGGDLEIYHDGSNSYIANSTGNIYIADTNGAVHIQAKLNEESIVASADGAVTLYHDNSAKLATASGGVTVTGTLTATTLAGTLSTAAQTNITSLGTLTGLTVNSTEVLFDNTGGDFTLKLNTNAVGDKNEIIMGDTSTPLVKFGVGGTADDIITGSDGQDFNIGTAGGGRAINFSTDNFGSVEMKFDGGKLGIGTTSPDTLLHLSAGSTGVTGGSGAAITMTNKFDNPDNSWVIAPVRSGVSNTGLEIRDVTDSRTDMVFDGAGKVGIGETSPQTELHVKGTNNSAGDLFTAVGAGNVPSITIQNAGTTDNNNAALFFRNDSAMVASIGARFNSHSNEETQLRFATTDTSGSTLERMVLFGDGKLGINQMNPSNLLTVDVNSATAGTDSISVQNRGVSSANHTTGLRFQFNSAVPAAIRSKLTNTSNGAGTLSFFTSSDGTSGNLSERMSIASGGDIFFGTTSSPNGTSVGGSAFINDSAGRMNLFLATTTTGAAEVANFFNGNGLIGRIHLQGTSCSYQNLSDYRLKENVNYNWVATDLLKQLKPAKFNFKTDKDTTLDGFLAHEVASVVPEAVSGDKDKLDEKGNPEYQFLDNSKLIPLLTKAIQEQQAVIEDLKTRIETLEG